MWRREEETFVVLLQSLKYLLYVCGLCVLLTVKQGRPQPVPFLSAGTVNLKGSLSQPFYRCETLTMIFRSVF